MLEKTKGRIKNGQSKDTGNFGLTRRRTKTNKTQTTTTRHRSSPVNVLFVIQERQNLRQMEKHPLSFKK